MINRADPHMRETDAFSWYMERDPLLRSTVVAVMLFDRAPDQRRVLLRVERASRIAPGLRHHLVEPPQWTARRVRGFGGVSPPRTHPQRSVLRSTFGRLHVAGLE